MKLRSAALDGLLAARAVERPGKNPLGRPRRGRVEGLGYPTSRDRDGPSAVTGEGFCGTALASRQTKRAARKAAQVASFASHASFAGSPQPALGHLALTGS
ncbi:MAG: hypothetical protein C5B60_10585 [Chloroflexi bacterium]|nr:MAG: hypothetical protein C5B60_10585 [Chloroflexota bacterium]